MFKQITTHHNNLLCLIYKQLTHFLKRTLFGRKWESDTLLNMSSGDLMISEKHTHSEEVHYYATDLSENPPIHANEKKECGCYQTIDFSETDRC